ncbi:MAG: hypothetical protein Q7R79_05465, partial [bacterium]|nr:hypothetical protein [bacterium]
ENEKEDIIARALRFEKMNNKEEALEELDAFLTPTQADRMVGGRFADRMAVHFAVEEVADGYYGSEKGNEIFIAYPSAMIASQYFFNKDLRQAPSGTSNDVFVWTQEEKGIDVNAGITFIPAEAKVDPRTGSKYELDESRKPKTIKKHVAALRSIIADPEFSTFVEHAQKTLGRLRWDASSEEVDKELKPYRDTLERKMTLYKGIDPRVYDVVLNYQNLSDFLSRKGAVDRNTDKKQALANLTADIERKLRESELLYEKPASTVSSKEFWEGHFEENPNSKPNKIVYYNGNDPTKALHDWRSEAGISPKGEGEGHLGFVERKVHMDAAAAMTGSDRFRSIALDLIDKRFDKSKAVL